MAIKAYGTSKTIIHYAFSNTGHDSRYTRIRLFKYKRKFHINITFKGTYAKAHRA